MSLCSSIAGSLGRCVLHKQYGVDVLKEGAAPPRPSPNLYWLIGAFISALLVSLVAVPLIINQRMAEIITEINERADPADKDGGLIQAALSHEVSGILGFQATGDKKYVDLYEYEKASIEKSLTNLRRLSPQLGPHVQARFSELESMVLPQRFGIFFLAAIT